MSFLDEIRNQPAGIRKAMFGLSVVAIVALAGTAWFHSFRNNVYALLNPETVTDTQGNALVKEEPSPSVESPFAAIGSIFQGMKANISGLFGGRQTQEVTAEQSPSIRSGKAQALPVSE